MKNYYECPEIGLSEGKWKLETRLKGLEYLLNKCEGSSILDLGCAEGMISYQFALKGAKLIHGFEYEKKRVDFADFVFRNNLPDKDFFFYQADLNDWEYFVKQQSEVLLYEYDIVLFLGIYHHLRPGLSRIITMVESMKRARKYWACRTPENLMHGIKLSCEDYGFEIVHEASGLGDSGPIAIMKRKHT